MARYDSEDIGAGKSGIDLYKEMLKTEQGRAQIDKNEADRWALIQKTEAEAHARTGGGFLGVLDKVLEPVMDVAIKATPYILAAGLGNAAWTAAGAGGGTAAGGGGGAAGGSGSVFNPTLTGGLPNVGELIGGMPTLGEGGGLIAAGGGGAGAGLGGLAGDIPQVIVPGVKPAATIPGWISGPTGIAVGDLIGGNNMPDYNTAPDTDDHLPTDAPVPGTEGNDYPIWDPDVFGPGGPGSIDPGQWMNPKPTIPGGGGGTPNPGGGLNIPGLIGGLNDYFNNNYNKDYYKGLIDKLNGMYAEGTPEEVALRQKIEAQDAASGRRSQYGVREINLAGILNQQRSNIMTNPVYASYVNAYTGKRDDNLNSLLGWLGSQTGQPGAGTGTGTGTGSGTSNPLGGLGSIIGGIGNVANGISGLGNAYNNIVKGGTNLANSLFGGW